MNNIFYIIIIMFVFILVLFVAYSDYGRYPPGRVGVQEVDAKSRFDQKRFPPASGSGMKGNLPPDLPKMKTNQGLKEQKNRFEKSQKEYRVRQDRVKMRSLEQQSESDWRARYKKPFLP